ncbi:hypothetical protein TUBRATIS_23590 [Tubulinosema ratisbonensis]|uniref:Uncharacterized protein n=1 Tax=Tubulinosema ratisbonensis TaxID=291195 RepID=A0A437AJC8_9MICR|nr:hypothetical protein TUBRATIS_23590 [Tubulinosema ratisbonensis]
MVYLFFCFQVLNSSKRKRDSLTSKTSEDYQITSKKMKTTILSDIYELPFLSRSHLLINIEENSITELSKELQNELFDNNCDLLSYKHVSQNQLSYNESEYERKKGFYYNEDDENFYTTFISINKVFEPEKDVKYSTNILSDSLSSKVAMDETNSLVLPDNNDTIQQAAKEEADGYIKLTFPDIEVINFLRLYNKAFNMEHEKFKKTNFSINFEKVLINVLLITKNVELNCNFHLCNIMNYTLNLKCNYSELAKTQESYDFCESFKKFYDQIIFDINVYKLINNFKIPQDLIDKHLVDLNLIVKNFNCLLIRYVYFNEKILFNSNDFNYEELLFNCKNLLIYKNTCLEKIIRRFLFSSQFNFLCIIFPELYDIKKILGERGILKIHLNSTYLMFGMLLYKFKFISPYIKNALFKGKINGSYEINEPIYYYMLINIRLTIYIFISKTIENQAILERVLLLTFTSFVEFVYKDYNKSYIVENVFLGYLEFPTELERLNCVAKRMCYSKDNTRSFELYFLKSAPVILRAKGFSGHKIKLRKTAKEIFPLNHKATYFLKNDNILSFYKDLKSRYWSSVIKEMIK